MTLQAHIVATLKAHGPMTFHQIRQHCAACRAQNYVMSQLNALVAVQRVTEQLDKGRRLYAAAQPEDKAPTPASITRRKPPSDKDVALAADIVQLLTEHGPMTREDLRTRACVASIARFDRAIVLLTRERKIAGSSGTSRVLRIPGDRRSAFSGSTLNAQRAVRRVDSGLPAG